MIVKMKKKINPSMKRKLKTHIIVVRINLLFSLSKQNLLRKIIILIKIKFFQIFKIMGMNLTKELSWNHKKKWDM